MRKTGSKNYALSMVALSLAIVNFHLSSAAFSQNTNIASLTNTYKQKQKQDFSRLKEPVDLPDLPAFPGNPKFVSGATDPYPDGIGHYQMSFLSQETGEHVMDWYKNAFSMYKWKVIFSGANSITAQHKDGHMCTIGVNSVIKKPYKSKILVYYRLQEAKK